ncbi:MAG: hypothetical protein Q9160_004830 [Pyrenula sp. 1 TL-2023]
MAFEQFQALFPKQHRAHPSIKILYKDLQFLRSVDIDVVQENIDRQIIVGERQKLLVYKGLHSGRTRTVDGMEPHQEDLDVHMFGPTGNLSTDMPLHDKESLIREMERACHDLENQLHETHSTAEQELTMLRETVSSLSDLRYGKFSKAPGSEKDLGEEVIAALEILNNACDENRLQ